MPADLIDIPLEDLLGEIRRRVELIEALDPHRFRRCRWTPVTNAVAMAWEIPAVQLWQPGRRAHCTSARQAAMVLMREDLKMTFEEIGQVFRLHHTTVNHALRTQDSRMTDTQYSRRWQHAKSILATTAQEEHAPGISTLPA